MNGPKHRVLYGPGSEFGPPMTPQQKADQARRAMDSTAELNAKLKDFFAKKEVIVMKEAGMDLGKLKEIAQAATPGEWVFNFTKVVKGHGSDGAHFATEPVIADLYVGSPVHHHPELAPEMSHLNQFNERVSYADNANKNCQFISTFNPKVALELIEMVEKKDEEIKILDDLVCVVNAAIACSHDTKTVQRLTLAMDTLRSDLAALNHGGDVK